MLISTALLFHQGKLRYTVILAAVAISLILWAQDSIVESNIIVPLNKVDSVQLTASKVDEDTKVTLFVSSSEIKSLFKADSATGPTYNNGKYYPTQKLKELYITISDDNIPYGLFAMADKIGF